MDLLVESTYVFPYRALLPSIISANTSIFCKGICRSCRGKMSNIGEKLPSVEESTTKWIREKRTGTRTIVYTTVDDSPVYQNPSPCVEPDTPGYQPQLPLPARSNKTSDKKTLEELNNLLRERDFSPVRHCLRDPWSSVSDRTKREHFRKINQGVQAVIGTIAPGQEDNVWHDFMKGQVEKCTRELPHAGNDYLEALIASYGASESKVTRIQILSIIVDLMPYNEIRKLLPEVTDYKLHQAKRHLLTHGRGQPLPTITRYRTGVTMPKIDHFIGFISDPNFVQEVAYGTRKLKLSSGEKIEMPNVVRNIITSRILKQYMAYCKETDFECLSTRELYRILTFCSAKQKIALQGLDNTSADGLRSIERLEDIARKLGERGRSLEWVRNTIDGLTNLKRYLKSTYRLHISSDSECADHCDVYALSDPESEEYSQGCDHTHDASCSDCDRFEQLFDVMKASFFDQSLIFHSEDEKNDLLHDVHISFEAIFSWKCHLLRAVHQDKAREQALEEWLSDSTKVFITQDFAMKFLPRRFKETQVEWFGKRGITWHISYCVRKLLDVGKQFEITVYSHIFHQTVSQNSNLVTALMRHTLQEQKPKHPELKDAYYRSDCAGSYASSDVLIPLKHMETLTAVSVRRYDFSEPQAGKGPCDRSSAHQKSHVTRYLNEGNDVMNALDIKRALESNNGVKGVVPYVVEGVPVSSTNDTRITGISLLHNFEYDSKGLRVWKAFDVGKGKLLKWNEFDKNSQSFPQELSVVEEGDKDQAYLFTAASKEAQSHDVCDKEDNEVVENSTVDESVMFHCPESGCVKQYITWGRLQRHIAAEKHTFQKKNEPVEDIVKRKWASLFTGTVPVDHASIEAQLSAVQLIKGKDLPQGWALKKSKKSKRFPIKVKQYLMEKFQVGETTGNKVDPLQVSVDMRCARDEQGKRMFSASECLSAQQIRGAFSRMSAAKRKGALDPSSVNDNEVQDILDDMEAEYYEDNRSAICNAAIQEATESHPIIYDRYDLCDLNRKGKLQSKFSLVMLKRICEHFELDTTDCSKTRKHDMLQLIHTVLTSCSCQMN